MESDSAVLVPPSKVLSAATHGAKDTFARNGLDPHTTFLRVGLDLDSISSPVTELSLRQYCELFEIASKMSDNEHIGLEFGKTFLPRHLGMLGYAAVSSPTLRSALRNMEKFFPAHQEQTSFRLFEDDGIYWLSYKILDNRIENRDQDAELSICMFVNIIKEALGKNWSPVEVRFEHGSFGSSNAHENVFGAPIEFNRRTNAIAIRPKDLDAIMPGHDPYLFTLVENFLTNRVSDLNSMHDFSELVCNEIKLNLGSKMPSLKDIAGNFGLSTGKFKCKIREHGLTYPDLLKAARKDLAIHYLNNKDISLLEIAYLLGYSELSAFSRAFKNWTGESPLRYRRNQMD